MSALLLAYRCGAYALEPFLPLLLERRARAGKEDPSRLSERRGIAGRDRPPGPLVWAHGASLGETLSLLPVVERIAARGVAVLVTSGTRTAADLLARRLPPGAFHQYVPLDAPRAVARFLDHWRPSLALAAESEVWPNTILALGARNVPLVLVNGRLSARSAGRWARAPKAAHAIFSRLTLVLAQSPEDARRFGGLGVREVEVAGNLKFDAPAPPADPAAVARLAGLVSGRPLLVAASTHPGEEEMVLAAHSALAARQPRLLTIVAPRHPGRGAAVAEEIALAGLSGARRSAGEEPGAATAIYLADTVGELGLFYRLSPVVFVGGSLVPHGGQNPIEAVRLGAAILHGPHVRNFAGAYAALDGAGAALRVTDAATLAEAAGTLLSDAAGVRAMARQGAAVVASSEGALARTLSALDRFLPPAERSGMPSA